MKLTDRILLSFLKKQFTVKMEQHIGTTERLRGPFMYEKGEVPEKGWVSIAADTSKVEWDSHFAGTFFVFTKGETMPEHLSGVILEGESTIGRVLNAVQRCFEYYEKWEEKLQKILTDQGNVQDLLQASLGIFMNPIMVISEDFIMHSLASSTPLPKEYHIFDGGKDQMEYVNAFMQNEAFQEGSRSDAPYWLPEYLTGYRCVCLNMRKENRQSYRLEVMEYKNLLGEECEDLLTILEPYVYRLLYHKTADPHRKNESLPRIFLQILSNRALDYVEASQRLSSLGWLRSHDYLCLVYKITYLDQKNYTANAICNYMEEHFPSCCSFSYREDIVTFFNLSLLRMDEEEVSANLKQFIRDSYLKAGYSRVMQGHLNLRRQYVQATLAVDVGSRKRPYMWIHHFNQIAFTYILEQITRKLPGDMLCHEKLLLLKEMDDRNKTEYVKTLRTYLNLHQNAVQSAKELYIHRSTFLYRLEKIKGILESELDDTEELLYLQLSMYLLDREEEKTS